MNEPKPLPSETKLVERLRDHENEGVTSSDRYHLREEAATALASLADELRLAQTELKGCYRLIDELKEDLRLAREEQIALLRFVEHPVTPEMWKALFPKEPR